MKKYRVVFEYESADELAPVTWARTVEHMNYNVDLVEVQKQTVWWSPIDISAEAAVVE